MSQHFTLVAGTPFHLSTILPVSLSSTEKNRNRFRSLFVQFFRAQRAAISRAFDKDRGYGQDGHFPPKESMTSNLSCLMSPFCSLADLMAFGNIPAIGTGLLMARGGK